jgi:hypothetical protein
MNLWRRYLEQYAESDESVEDQTVVAAYHSAEVFAALSLVLDRGRKYRGVIRQRMHYFDEGSRRAAAFEDRLLNASFSIYNHTNTLAHQLTDGNSEAGSLIDAIEEQARIKTAGDDPVGRSAAALRAVFPLLGLMSMLTDDDGALTTGIRHVEQRFTTGAGTSPAPSPQLVNALYRDVEMMQVLVVAFDRELAGQVEQIGARFKEEDHASEMMPKLRNGFCRLFELGHLLTTHLDELIGGPSTS